MSKTKDRFEYVLKHNSVIQFLYKHIASVFFRFLGLFIRTDDKLILFNSFGGRKFNDSPKVLFYALLNDPRFKDFKFVWAFENPERFKIPEAELIKINSLIYFTTALKAKVWISSVNIERGLHFKKKKTIYINTWHGAGTKLIGNACNGRKDYNFSAVDIMLVQSAFERQIFERDFACNPQSIHNIGFPRNDELFHITQNQKAEYRKLFNIPEGKKVILYAPTWRDSRDGGLSYEFTPPISITKWENTLSEDYVMLFRMHTLTTKFEMTYNDFARDVSSYDNLNHILAITDVLVTDYSTIVYDAAIAEIPFICFGFDYETYKNERGFYFDLNEVYPGGVFNTEDQVLNRIAELEQEFDKEKFKAFRNAYIEAGGSATETILNELASKLSK